MKCFYHPTVDAVGLCTECSKAACSNCIADVGGALLCTDCIARRTSYYQAQQKAISILSAADASKARSRIIGSFVVAAVGFYLGSYTATTGLFLAYVFWAGYWGIPYMWHYWRSLLGRSGCFFIATPVGWLVLLALFFYVPIASGVLWGALGGGLSEFLKTLRIARNQSGSSSPGRRIAAFLVPVVFLLILLSVVGRNKTQEKPSDAATPTATPESSPTAAVAATSVPTPSPADSPSLVVAKAIPVSYRVSGLAQRDFLNVRQGPAATHPVIAKLRQGERGIKLGTGRVRNGSTTWQEVSVRGNTGWVNAAYLAPDASSR